MTSDPKRHWTILRDDIVFDARPFLTVHKHHVALPNGHQIDDFYQVDLRHFALVVPITTKGNVLMGEGYRHGPRSIELTFPGGFIDPGENTTTAIKREMTEETGHACKAYKELGTTIDNGNQKGGTGTYFLGTGAERQGQPILELGEDFVLKEFTVAEVDAMLARGAFGLTHTVVAWALARPHIHP